MSGSSLHLRLPDWSLFKFPPDPAPPALPPPSDEATWKSPFPINAKLYNDLLSPIVPITIATIYATTVTFLNAYNRKRGNKPWAISKTRPFRAFVILHNLLLALYSLLTFIAMVRALRHTIPGPHDAHGVVDVVDSLCKMNGPRGLGDAAEYDPTSSAWAIKNKLLHLGEFGTPDPTDVGRLWNEGLSFWGWFFYLSKFYEVLDTAIIIAKGKRSSTLQTYHHAGAMLSMWAGIRYMSPPIWMFVCINSLIHALMYTYYTLSALGVRVPQMVKRTLTTMQIAQFVIGTLFAASHLFISYTVPVSTPYTVVTKVRELVTAIASAASSAVSDVAHATASAGVAGLLKKIALRAAGEEGLAENVRNEKGQVFGAEAERYVEREQQDVRYRSEYQRVDCINTSGQAFAIWLNLIYLLPLTALFIRFFIRSYTRRGSASAKHPTMRRRLSKSARDAVHGVDREIETLGKSIEDEIPIEKISGKVQEIKSNGEAKARRVSEAVREKVHAFENNSPRIKDVKEVVKQKSQQALTNGEAAVEKAKEYVEKGVEKAREVGGQAAEKIQEVAEEVTGAARERAPQAKEQAQQAAETVKDKASEAAGTAGEKVNDAVETVKEQAPQVKEKAQRVAEDVKERAQDTKQQVEERGAAAKEEAEQKAGEVKDKAGEKAGELKDRADEKAQETTEAASEKTQEAKDKGKEKAQEVKDKAEKKADKAAEETKQETDAAEDESKQESRESPPGLSGSWSMYSGGQRDEQAAEHDQEARPSTGESQESQRDDQDKENQDPDGLSSDDPHQLGISYAEMMKAKEASPSTDLPHST